MGRRTDSRGVEPRPPTGHHGWAPPEILGGNPGKSGPLQYRPLGVKPFMKPPYSALPDETIASQQTYSIFVLLHALRIKRPLPFHPHPIEVPVQAKLVAFSRTSVRLVEKLVEEPLCPAAALARMSLSTVAFKSCFSDSVAVNPRPPPPAPDISSFIYISAFYIIDGISNPLRPLRALCKRR